MRWVTVLLLVACSCVCAADPDSALQALELLPQEKTHDVVRIEGRDGTPIPERWYVIVRDAESDHGYREFVLANKVLVASRTLSQFADEVKEDDVIDADRIKVDSSAALKTAVEYAAANDVEMARVDYTLQKEDGSPVWNLRVFDKNGERLGQFEIDADGGELISHEGFEKTPKPEEKVTPTPRPTPRPVRVRRAEPVAERPQQEEPPRRRPLVERVWRGFSRPFGD